MKSPFPYFGGKSAIAPMAWQAFGDIQNYVEPFFGSGAVLLNRPKKLDGIVETVNDLDGFIANFWRSIQADPDAVAKWADYPVIESDLEARHYWLMTQRQRVTEALADPHWHDPKVAGWWVWGISAWIGGGWCSGEGPWIVENGRFIDTRERAEKPATGISRRLPSIGDRGRGVNRQHETGLSDYIHLLSCRLRKVRVACGDWSRVMGPSVTEHNGITGIFLDPPYSMEANRDMGLYACESGDVAHDVRAWCQANGNNPKLRIILCGYDTEHDLPGWTIKPWKTQGGYANQGDKQGKINAGRECLWLSPHCRTIPDQQILFDDTQPPLWERGHGGFYQEQI